MSKTNKNNLEATTEVVMFKSAFKNLVVAGTNIVFRDGFYETNVTEEIESLRENSLVFEIKEDNEAGE